MDFKNSIETQELSSLSSRVEAFFDTARDELDRDADDSGKCTNNYFASLQDELDRAREEIGRHRLQFAPEFNVFDYIRPDENLLSDIFADLLNPNGAHGQRDCFLRLFIDRLNMRLDRDLKRATVNREDRTRYIANARRRIDIVVGIDQFGIGIENKPWSKEMVNQLKDYMEQMRRRFGDNFLIVYLSGDGSAPQDSWSVDELIDLEKHGQFRLLAYPMELRGWLEDCVKHSKAARISAFLCDLGLYVEREFKIAVLNWRHPDAEE